MDIDQGLFTFIIALAAVINGLGIVRIVGVWATIFAGVSQ